jgi:hypothetical protein
MEGTNFMKKVFCVRSKNTVVWGVFMAVSIIVVFLDFVKLGCSETRRFGEHTASVFGVPQGDSITQLKNGVFWDVTPCGSCKNRHFGGT